MQPRVTGLALLGCVVLAASAVLGADGVRVSHLFELSDFNGPIPYTDAVLHADRHHDEVYAVVGNDVRVFNRSGMEIYRFSHDRTLGKIVDLEVDADGDILTLNFDSRAPRDFRASWIQRCDYRGEPTSRIDLRGLPQELESFVPNRIFDRDGRFFLVSTGQLRVVVVDGSGDYREHLDLADLLGIDDPEATKITGFSFDRSGNMLFTIAVLFRAFVVSPDGAVREFGSAGSAPGKFGVAAGIAATDDGHYLVADKLRDVVMVFDSSFRLVTEFAGGNRWGLVRPSALVVGNAGTVYVTQGRERGVAVLGLSPASVDQTSEEDSTFDTSRNGSLGESG
jgi:hypothetical protein